MAELLFKIFISMMILPFWALITQAIEFPADKLYLFAILFGFAFILYLHEKLLSFLTMEKVFITSILASSIMLSAFLYFADLSIPGFSISDISLGGLESKFVNLPEFQIGFYGTIALLAIVSGMTYYLLMKLKSET